ncbi:hypothetical protein ACFQX6_35000 [Streptosporangium lutulentum]
MARGSRDRRDRHRHLLGDRAQPRPREQDPELRDDLGRPGEQLSRRRHRPGLHLDGERADPVLDVSKSADKTTVTPGGIVTYTITVANTGQTPTPEHR